MPSLVHSLRHLVGASAVIAALAGAPIASIAAETYDEVAAGLDLTNPDDLVVLAEWCRENRRHRSATRHLREALAIDTNHIGARTALGFIWYNERWVHESRLPSGARQQSSQGNNRGGSGGTTVRRPSTPGPSAAEIQWDLTLPADPEPDAPYSRFLDEVIAEFPRLDNYSGRMESGIATLLQDDYFYKSIHHLAKAMAADSFTDLYAASMLISEVMKSGSPDQQRAVRALLPFMVSTSARVRDTTDLYMFGLAVGGLGDKRAVPRLIELVGHSDRDVADGARAGIHLITMMAEREVTAASAKEWWDLYHQSSDSAIFADMLGSRNDALTRLEAAKRLYREQDKRIVPVLIELIGGDNMTAALGAAGIVERICGNDWGIVPGMAQADRAAAAERLSTWWDENKNTFVWLEFRNTGGSAGQAPRRDPLAEAVGRLASIEAGVADSAMAALRRGGDDAIGHLIDGLARGDLVIRTRSRDLLREITGQNFGYSPAGGSNADRDQARERWIAWAIEAGHLSDEASSDQ